MGDPTYLEGLKAALGAAIDYALAGIQSPDRSPPPTPPQLLVQARLAAQGGVGLDIVLRRYLAGYTLLCDILVDEVRKASAQEGLRRLLRAQAARFERLIMEVGEEHRRAQGHQAERHTPRLAQRRLELVRRALDGAPLDTSELAYDFETTHLAITMRGPRFTEPLRQIAKRLDCRLLSVRPDEEVEWAWLACKGQVDLAELKRQLGEALPKCAFLAIGEPGKGAAGWRLTHRQAQAALAVAIRGPEPVVRYAEVALLASVMQDELLATSLREMYLEPLEGERDGGAGFYETLRAYFECERNSASAAVRLQVARQTVNNRLRAIEELIGRSLPEVAAELEVALRLDDYSVVDGRT